jgi:activating signal cointegrator 1
MKALTIRQPFATLIMLGIKTHEFRSWFTHYRGPLSIHAAQALHASTPEVWKRHGTKFNQAGYHDARQLPTSAILGSVHVMDCVEATTLKARVRKSHDAPDEGYALVLAKPQPLQMPVKCKGALGLWTVPASFGLLVRGAEYSEADLKLLLGL